MKGWMLVIAAAALVSGCATYHDDYDARGVGGYDVGYTAGADGTYYTHDAHHDLYSTEIGHGSANVETVPNVYGYDNDTWKKHIVRRPSYGFGPPNWTGTFMPDYMRGAGDW
jgi:hypothetical protein